MHEPQLDGGVKFYINMITFYLVRLIVLLSFVVYECIGVPSCLCPFAGSVGLTLHNITSQHGNGAVYVVYACPAPLDFIPILLSAAGTPIA